jgi:hypothetical protein
MNVDDRARMATAQLDQAVETRAASADERTAERFERFRARKDRNRRVGAIVLVTIVFVAILVSAIAVWPPIDSETPGNTNRFPPSTPIGTLTLTRAGCDLAAAATPVVGPYTMTVINTTSQAKTVVVFEIASDARFERLLAVIENRTPLFGRLGHHSSQDARIVSRFYEYAGTSETDVSPHVTLEMTGGFDAGTYGIQCVGRLTDRDTPDHFVGPIHVAAG